MKLKYIFFSFLIISLFLVLGRTSVRALTCDLNSDLSSLSKSELQDCANSLTDKVNQLKGQAQTLSSEVNYLNTQITLTELNITNATNNIQDTIQQIAHLTGNISDLGTRIGKIKDSMDYQQMVLDQRMRTRYKSLESSSLVFLFGSDTLNNLVIKSEYLKVMEATDRKLLTEMSNTKDIYNNQKTQYEQAKQDEEMLRSQLIQEKSNLEASNQKLSDQKAQKNNLLVATQNNESKYQELLTTAKNQLEGFTNFVSSAGGGVIDANGFGIGKEGWYLSQRDTRWAHDTIGSSNSNIFDVGCLVTSLAMVYRHYGQKVTPADIASQDYRFFDNTAMMLIPWKGPSGRSYNAISASSIDGKLKNGTPVIVGIYAGSFGTHFVVLSSRTSSGDYIMYDPYYGPDLVFSSRYSKGSIFQAVTFE